MKTEKPSPTKDFGAMDADDWLRLDVDINNAINKYDNKEAVQNAEQKIDASLTRMNACITQAINECVPDKKRRSEKKGTI